MHLHRTLLLAGLLIASAATATAVASPLTAGDQTVRLKFQRRDRSYIAHLPPTIREKRSLPVVLNFHGGGGSAAQQQGNARMDELADREGFIVVYPNGPGRFADRLLTWNAGTCCACALTQKIDDVSFVAALLDDLARRAPIDRSRVYATGFSNGAMMAQRLAAERPDLVAAIAPVGGSMVLERTEPRAPVPVMHIHSVDDPRALYEGGLGPPFPGTNHRVGHPPVSESLERWRKANGCVSPGHVAETRTSGTHSAEKISFSPCITGAELVHWKLHGSGHVWPGAEPTRRERLTGPATTVIDTNEEIWKFFREKRVRGN